jgi:hypothetical protein
MCVNPNDIPSSGGITGSGGAGGTSASVGCLTGGLRCACYPNDTCNANLTCLSQICVELPGTGGAGSGGAVVSGGTTASSGGAGGASACASGDVRCACYPNNTCNADLACVSNVCVQLVRSGGTTASGGVVVSGGSIASGGGVVFSGGTIASGGGVVFSGGSIASGGVVVSGGTIASGGVVVSGGTIASSGGASASTTQVCSDATHCSLGLDGSGVPASGNSYGIDGTFYVVGDPCTSASITWNAATRCASGILCAKDPPYYSNWGVEIALNLHCGGGYDYGYDASANGVAGFFWEVTGTAPGMQVWVALAANMGACLQTTNLCALQEPPWGNPTPSMGPAGNNSVMIQPGYMSYDDWGLGYTYPPPWDPTRLHSVQWKLPARALSTPFSFCVQNVGVIHN